MDFDKLGTILKSSRKAHDITQEEMAQYCGLTRNYISAMERGINKPSAQTLILYAQKCGISIDELLGLKEVKPIVPELYKLLLKMDKKDQEKVARIIMIIKE